MFVVPRVRSVADASNSWSPILSLGELAFLTPVGSFIRRNSIDELPQLLSIWRGDMSFVGPRPALFNQHDLISARTAAGVDQLVSGLTGWAQINGRDDLPIPRKVEFDAEYSRRRSFLFDVRILWMTAVNLVRSKGVFH